MAKVPYEFLVRWNHLTGEYQGAHVKVYDNTNMQEGDAQSVAVGSANGFPLATILTAIEQGAIVTADNAIAALTTEREAARVALEAAAVVIAARDAEILALKTPK